MAMAHTTDNNEVVNTVRFLRVGEVGREVPVIQDVDGRSYDLSAVTDNGDLDGAFLARGGLTLAVEALERGDLPERTIDGLRIGPPVARPAAVICIGQNYAAHAAETGAQPPKT